MDCAAPPDVVPAEPGCVAGFCAVLAPLPPVESVPVVPLPDGEGVEGWVVEAGGVNERRTPLPDLVESCPPVVGAATSGTGDGEPPLIDCCVPGVRVDLAGAVLRDPRLDAPEPDVALEAELDEPELPEELPPTCASAAVAPARSKEKAIE